MKRYIFIAAAMLMLAACDTQQATKLTVDLKQVRGLEDCTYYKVDPGGTTPIINVIRCPNSTTSSAYTQGKARINTVVIDGVEYVQRDPAQ